MSLQTCNGALPEAAASSVARERSEGARAMAPMLLAYAPFAVVVGTAVAQSNNQLAAWLGTSTIYGGAAHLAVLDILSDGGSWMSAASVGLLINMRLAAFATSMVPEWRTAPLRLRLIAAVMLVDAPWALSRGRADRNFFLGAAAALFVAWPVMVTAGMLLGGWLSALAVTGILPALSLGALVVPRLRVRPIAWAACGAVVTALATAGLPAGTSLALCAAVGCTVATVARRRLP